MRASALALQRVVALHTVQLAKRGSGAVDKGALLADMRKCVPAFTALATTGDESGHGGASTGMGTMYKGHPDQKVLDALFGFSQIRAVARSRMPMDELPLRTVLANVLQANGVKRTAQRALAALRLVPYPHRCDKVSDALNVIKNNELRGVLAPGARVSQQMVRGEYISPYMDNVASPKVADHISADATAATTNAPGAQAVPRIPKRERRRASLATVAESDEPVAASSNTVPNPDCLNSPMEQSSPPPLAAPVRLLNLTLNSGVETASRRFKFTRQSSHLRSPQQSKSSQVKASPLWRSGLSGSRSLRLSPLVKQRRGVYSTGRAEQGGGARRARVRRVRPV